MNRSVLVYRDLLLPASERSFMQRQYCGFTRLRPIWLGRHLVPGTESAEIHRLGGEGLLGAVRRLAFKELGAVPDLAGLVAMRPAVVHAQFGRGGAFALPLARALGLPLAVTFHGGDAHKDVHYRRFPPALFARRLPALMAEAKIFICVSDSVRNRLIERGFPRAKLVVLPVGTEMPPTTGDEPRSGMLFVGRFVEKKGLGTLISALQLLRSEGREPQAVIVGDGDLADRLKAEDEARGLMRLRFTGWLPPEEVGRLMRQAAVLVVPSLRAIGGDAEGLPSVAVEAMAAGLPVIASDEAGLAGVVQPGVTGVMVPARDARGLADAIDRSLADPAGLQALGNAARAFAAETLDARKQSAELEELLLSI